VKRSGGFTLLEITIAMAVIVIVVGGIFLGTRGNNNNAYRALETATLVLQADLRYTQRRAIMEGRRVGIFFEPARNRYSIITMSPFSTIRTVYLRDGVVLAETSHPRLMFLPRGTASSGFRVTLNNGIYTQRVTATVSGGQVRIHDIIREVAYGAKNQELHGGCGSRQNVGDFENHAGRLRLRTL